MEGRILIADDDCDIANLIEDILTEENFEVEKAYTGIDALRLIKERKYDLILLDIMLPELSGFDICRYSDSEERAPVVFLTAKNSVSDKVYGFELGAYDYITKPFDNEELAARVKAHIKRSRNEISKPSNEEIIRFKNIEVFLNSYEVRIDGEKIELSSREFQILVYLMKNCNEVLTRERIYEKIWGNIDSGDINTVTVHIKKLREKLGKEGSLIKTVWGTGYKFAGERP